MPEIKIKDITDIFLKYGEGDVGKTKEYIQNLIATTEVFELPDTRELCKQVLLKKGGTSSSKGMLIVELIISHIERDEGLIIPYNNYQEFALILDGKIILIDEEIDTYLGREFDYIPSDATWRQVRERLYNYAISKKDIQVDLFSTYKNNSIYVGYKDKGILKITGSERKFQLQGEDNVYVQSNNKYDEVNPDETLPIKSMTDIFDLFTYDGDKETQKFLLKAWFYFTFFNPSMRTALCVTGQPGCGKSFLLKLLKGTLFGFDNNVFNPNTMPEEDYVFALMMKESKHIFLDEVNESTKAMKSKLRTIVTGEEVIMRLKYAKKNIKFYPKLWLLLAAHSPKFREADIAQRLLIIKLLELPRDLELIEEHRFMEKMAKSRGTIWEDIILELQSILTNLGEKQIRIPLTNYCRQVEMANFAYNAFPKEREICIQAFDSMSEVQSDFSAEFDPVMDLLEELLSENIEGVEDETVEYTSKTLHEALRPFAQEKNIKIFPATVNSFAQWVNRRSSILEKRFGFQKKRDNKKNSYIYIFDKPSTDEKEVF